MFGGKESVEALHLSAESSQETISEAQRLSDEICQMLLAAGYFRARIPTLPPFDKMLGGLAWCITASNVDVDVDLHFDEEMTLGQKIKLGENVIAALRKMECPCQLQPHQLQGLDFQALFLVFQWLVKHVLSRREELAAKTRRFAEMKFESSKHQLVEEVEEKERRTKTAPLLEKVMDRYKPKRQFRRRDALSQLPQAMQAQCVLLEYGHALPASASGKTDKGSAEDDQDATAVHGDMLAVEGDLDFLSGKRIGALVGMQGDMIGSLSAGYSEHAQLYGQNVDPETASRRGKEQAHKRLMASMERQLQVATAKCKARAAAYETLVEQVHATQAALEEQQQRTQRVVRELAKLKAAETPENAKELEALEQLVSLNDRLKEQQEAFRAHCKRQRHELASAVEHFEESGGLPPDELERLHKVEALYTEESQKLARVRALLARKTQETHMLRRKIDDVATRGELVQYERRFVELYEQMATNLEVTRRYYTKYNTLTDAHKYLNKEISILNSISSKWAQISASESLKNSFLTQMETIRSGVQENLTRVKAKYDSDAKKREELAAGLAKVMERQRVYFRAVKEFQEECTKNEALAT